MGLIRNIVIAVSAISFFTFVALFGQLPALRKTPIGWLHRLLRYRIPSLLARLDAYITGGKISQGGQRLGNYLFYKKNPAVLILFLGLLTGSAFLFLRFAIPELPTRLILPIPALLVQPYLFTWLCAAYKGHYITPETHNERLHDYPYDHVLFQPNNTCRTCHLIKPARSKHCNFCGVCIAMCDHHCPWVNNCVGRGNYRYFMALLLSLSLTEMYGAYLSWWILRPYLRTNPANATFSRARLDDLLNCFVVAVNQGGLSIAGVGMLTAATCLIPLALFGYHCYLIWAGMTTNESSKWADWREDMQDGCVFKASKKALQLHDQRTSLQLNGSHDTSMLPQIAINEPHIAWPVYSDQVVAYTEDGRPPAGEEALWTRIWHLREVDNIYDLGGWENFKDVLKGR